MDKRMKLASACVWMFVMASSAGAADVKPFEFSRTEMNSAHGFDNLNLPADFAVFAAGGSSGRKLDFTIDESGHEATQIDVAVHYTNRPVILMLGAHEPTIWNIGWSTNTHIFAVLASGSYRQAVAGLDPNVPLVISTAQNQGLYGYFYIARDKMDVLDRVARRLFGRSVDSVYPARDGKVLVGNTLPPGITLVTSKETPPESFHDTNAPLAGRLGIEDAVRKGILRNATEADVDAWVKAATAATPKSGVVPRPRVMPEMPCYVVLQPFRYPGGLYGANSATFFVPKGVPMPTGERAHCTVFDFNTVTAEGPGAY